MVRPIRANESYPWDLLTLADPSLPLIKEYLRSGAVFVAEAGGRVVGVSVLRGLSPRRGELVNIAVDPDVQGRGIGTAGGTLHTNGAPAWLENTGSRGGELFRRPLGPIPEMRISHNQHRPGIFFAELPRPDY